MKSIALPSADRLLARLSYEPETGIVRWLDCACKGRRLTGEIAGSRSKIDGYLRIKFDGRRYLLHRIIWKMQTGTDPSRLIDHKDGTRVNNAWENLRESNSKQNQQNRSKITGAQPKGVYFDRKRAVFVAQIRSASSPRYLGSFATAQAAHATYCEAARSTFGQFANPGSEGVFG